MSQRIEWIDCWKGLAIITVVVGHIVNPVSKYIFWFHMPLFFFISGYLYSKKTDYSAFFKKKLLHLLVPYFSFLFLFTLLQYLPLIIDSWQHKKILSIDKLIISIFPVIWKQLYGGANLALWFSVFWFVTCLFITQQLYNLLYIKFGSNNWLMIKIMLGSYCLAMINYYLKNVAFPWNINVVAMALPFYWLGHMAAKSFLINTKILILGTIIFLTAILLDTVSLLHFAFNMKGTSYGVLIFNVVIALSGIIITQQFALLLYNKSYIGNALRELGNASMIVMYLHQPIQITMKNYPIFAAQGIRVLGALIISYIIYKITCNFSIMRQLFLGDFSTPNAKSSRASASQSVLTQGIRKN
ncbi:acyltransferase family protein [Nostoc punctiforme]|uniref:Acyltransferase 3 n=1 Tax=Nostoc punctiforme (strain ATCC 29133 / PCC 73102) TaxID=63737 RepID=B2IZH7_NOSP7|nr:acyltransferase family protein [Nostoc punctiforme]ACC84819.1 acyltransferase 3 [Nostoc punctiforme PCC 73102]